MAQSDIFLPGVPAEHVLQRFEAAGGNEVASGKLAHPESSAALAVNAFGWFIPSPIIFQPFPGPNMQAPLSRSRLSTAPGSHGPVAVILGSMQPSSPKHA